MALSTRLGLLILLLSTAAAVAAEKEPLTLAKAKELRASAVASQMRRAAHHNCASVSAGIAATAADEPRRARQARGFGWTVKKRVQGRERRTALEKLQGQRGAA